MLAELNINVAKKFKKKVNSLKIKECEKILSEQRNIANSDYYRAVFKHYNTLLLNKERINNNNEA